MDFLPALGDSISPFGEGLQSFLDRCDRRHPDLKSEPVSSFLRQLDEISKAAEFCAIERLYEPLEILFSRAPKSHPLLLCMTRALKDEHREKARLAKSTSYICFSSLRSEVIKSGDDLPESFCVFRGDRDSARSRSSLWRSAASNFDLIGCSSMSSASARLAEECEPGPFGFFQLSVRRAAQILFKSRGPDGSFPGKIFVGPPCASLLSEDARASLDASEVLLDGFPFFDHHVLLSLRAGDRPGSFAGRDYCLLGERDGDCYFVCSD